MQSKFHRHLATSQKGVCIFQPDISSSRGRLEVLTQSSLSIVIPSPRSPRPQAGKKDHLGGILASIVSPSALETAEMPRVFQQRSLVGTEDPTKTLTTGRPSYQPQLLLLGSAQVHPNWDLPPPKSLLCPRP